MLRPAMAQSSTKDRGFDLVVWGASGFTGRLVAEHLFSVYGIDQELRWAIAGRDAGKLGRVRSDLGPGAEDLAILTGDCNDADSLLAIANSTRVVCTTVGPYLKYGEGMLAACAETGTDYCDLTGEVLFIHKMLAAYEPTARRTGARIVNSCGFDSIPSDIGTYFVQREFEKRFGHFATDVRFRLKVAKGALSGGTVDSMMNIIDTVKSDPSCRKTLANPFALCPDVENEGKQHRDQTTALFDDQLGVWTAPFIMAGINTRIVRRTNAIMGYPWGPDFSYTESVQTGTGLSGQLRARMISAGLKTFMFAASIPATRALMFRLFLPKPGQGPDADQRLNGFFNIALLASDRDGNRLLCKLTGDRDPGYGATSRMLGETAVCLAKDSSSQQPGGFFTPAAAIGDALIPRLRSNAGIELTVVDAGSD